MGPYPQIAGFIFGGNTRGESISMTSPVVAENKIVKGDGEKIAMTSPVTTEMQDNRCARLARKFCDCL